MFNTSQRTMLRTNGTLVGRVLIGLMFFFAGVGIVSMTGIEATVGFYESVGIPAAGLLVWVVIAIKLLAGGALIVGYRTEMAALLLVIFTVIATLVVHMDLQDPNLFKNLAIIGGLLYVMAYGAGDGWSIENKSDHQTVSTGNMAI